MAAENPLWGAGRIRGELGNLSTHVAKRTIQTYSLPSRAPHPRSQSWATFLRNHAHEIWACDFLHTTDLCFRPLFAFFVIALGSRRIVHSGVTRHPTVAWGAQLRREATPFEGRPRFLIRDNDNKYGGQFDRLATASGIRTLRTPVRAPLANGTCERFLGSVRRECTDHLLILGEAHLRRVLRAYVAYFHHDRPHQGIGQAIPARLTTAERHGGGTGQAVACPILGGLHHAYRRVA